MNVIVFGATGTIGKHLVQQSLDQGYHVTAFYRSEEKMKDLLHPNLSKLKGDVFNPQEVAAAIDGQEVVYIALGSGNKRKSVVRSVGTKHIIEGMKKHGVNRLICQTTLGAGDSQGNLNFFWKYIMFGWFLKQIFLDHELQEEYIMESGLDWTIVRPSAFTDGEKTEQYHHGFGSHMKSLKLKISRADVADFMLKQIGNARYIHQTPGVSY